MGGHCPLDKQDITDFFERVSRVGGTRWCRTRVSSATPTSNLMLRNSLVLRIRSHERGVQCARACCVFMHRLEVAIDYVDRMPIGRPLQRPVCQFKRGVHGDDSTLCAARQCVWFESDKVLHRQGSFLRLQMLHRVVQRATLKLTREDGRVTRYRVSYLSRMLRSMP